MPTYQYVCTQCETPLEAVQKFSDPALTECPTCQGALRKVFSAVGVVFKGSGFYKTDSRSGSKAAAPAGSSSESKGSESKSSESKGSESKGDASGTKKQSATAATGSSAGSSGSSSGAGSSASSASTSSS